MNHDTLLKEMCDLLDIKYRKNHESYTLNIPRTLKESFSTDTVNILISELDQKHAIFKTLSSLTSDNISGLAKAQITENDAFKEKGTYLIGWFKHKIYAQRSEEYIKGYSIHLNSQKVQIVSEEILNNIEESDFPMPLDDQSILHGFNHLKETSLQDLKRFLRFKNFEQFTLLNHEINRINLYYNLLKKENAKAESMSTEKELTSKEERTILENEKSHLIEQQKEKFQLTDNHLQILPLSFLLLKVN